MQAGRAAPVNACALLVRRQLFSTSSRAFLQSRRVHTFFQAGPADPLHSLSKHPAPPPTEAGGLRTLALPPYVAPGGRAAVVPIRTRVVVGTLQTACEG